MNWASVEPSSPVQARSSTAGCRFALAGLAGLNILQALKHMEIRTQEAVQHLPSVAVVTEVEFGPKHNGRQKCTKYKSHGHGCCNRLSRIWGSLSIRNSLSDDSAGLKSRIGFNGCPSLQVLGESALASCSLWWLPEFLFCAVLFESLWGYTSFSSCVWYQASLYLLRTPLYIGTYLASPTLT